MYNVTTKLVQTLRNELKNNFYAFRIYYWEVREYTNEFNTSYIKITQLVT